LGRVHVEWHRFLADDTFVV
jgi:hypothetical protein